MHKVHELMPQQAAELEAKLGANCETAARAIAACDRLLICTGAGWSADSGLRTYSEIENYADLASEGTMYKNSDKFHAFWVEAMHSFMEARPHSGYDIVKQWGEAVESRKPTVFFEDSSTGRHVGLYIAEGSLRFKPGTGMEPVKVEEMEYQKVRRRVMLKKNLDKMMSPMGFDVPRDLNGARIISKIKKLAEKCPGLELKGEWDAVADADRELGRAAPVCPGYFVVTSNVDGHFLKADYDKGCVREMHGTAMEWQCKAPCRETRCQYNKNRMCPKCGKGIRPATLLFGDTGFVDDVEQERNFSEWLAGVDILPSPKVVILEAGAGPTVTSIRHLTATTASRLSSHGANVSIIRVNPHHPLPDGLQGDNVNRRRSASLTSAVKVPGKVKHIPILEKGLAAVLRIDALLGAGVE